MSALPKGWKRARLDAVATLERATLRPEEIATGTRSVGMENIDGSGAFVDVGEVEAGELASNKFAFTPEHVLYGKLRPYLMKIARPDFAGACSTEILPIRANGTVSRDYLFHYLRQPRMIALANSRTAGANLPRLSPTDLATFPIDYPADAEEQRRIAGLLDEADALRRRRAEMIRLAGELVPSVFREMFGDIGKDASCQLPLDEVAEIGTGVMKGRKFNGQPVVELPYLRVANVQAGYLDLSEIKSITLAASDVERSRLRHHDVVLTEGGDHDKLGRGALWESQVDPCVHQNHIFRVRCDPTRLLPRYFAEYIRSSPAVAYFRRCAKKTTNLATINLGQLKRLPVHLPPLVRQGEFAERLAGIHALLTSQGRSARDLDALFRSLLHRAFRGEL
ncbi:MAG: hypothetical protein K2W96_18860 [Gemmataceae bacterium]|nr:hypothetical protein [Gemmataceae bacterium]